MPVIHTAPTALDISSHEGEKPCRACTDFKQWTQIQFRKTSNDTTQKKFVDKSDEPKPCPLDKTELGHAAWGLLHSVAAYYPDKPTASEQDNMKRFIDSFSRVYPCEVCAEDFQKEITKDPPKVESQHAFAQWMCDMHNKVNVKLGKPTFDCTKVNERWRDGWLDGSCD